MPTVDEIKDMIHNVNPTYAKGLLKMKEIPELVSFLATDEVILKITPAFLNTGSWKSGVFVATDRRCFFLYKGGFFTKVITEQFTYDKISSVEYITDMVAVDLTIHSSGNSIKLKTIANSEVRELCEFLNSRAHTPTASSNDVISQLERLVALKTQGALNEEEFIFSKKKLLGM
jgi:hypothetical protein